MKARFIRDDCEVAAHITPEQRAGKTHKAMLRGTERDFWNKGAELELPDIWRLVRMGTCEPADEECAQRAKMTNSGMAAAQHAYERLTHGIHPGDYDLFDAGVIVGYEPDEGYHETLHPDKVKYKPGPNWHLLGTMRPDEAEEEVESE